MPVREQDYQQLVRGTPFAVYASHARRNMRTSSQSSHPPMATPTASQSGSLPDMDYSQYPQYTPLSQSCPSYSSFPSTYTGYNPSFNEAYDYRLNPDGYQSSSGPLQNASTISGWATETARLYPINLVPTPLIDNQFNLATPELMGSLLPAAPVGTVQPSAIFGQVAPRDASLPQTALGTPDTSARATPHADELSFAVHKITPTGPNTLWQPLAPKTDPVPSAKTLKVLQTPPESAEDLESEHSGDDSPLHHSMTLQTLSTKLVTGEKKKRTRTPQACEACRKRKAKCTGGQPCGRCTTKRIGCVFADIRPKPISNKPPTLHGVQRQPVPLGQKKRRHSENARMAKEAGGNAKPLIAASSVEVEQGYSPNTNNLLQLHLDAPQYPTMVWPQYSSQPAYGYTGSYDPSGMTALGFQQPYLAPNQWAGMSSAMPTPAQFTGFNNLILSDSSEAPLMTPSMSSNSSPSYADASLLSPTDYGVFGPMATDSYFPSTEA